VGLSPAWGSRSHGKEIGVLDQSDVLRAESNDRPRASGCGDTFHVHCVRSLDLDNGTHVAALETVLDDVSIEHDNVE